MRCRFYTVDAFTDRAFEGAQIVVLPDARGLNDTQMQKIAREFNVSETVFGSKGFSKTRDGGYLINNEESGSDDFRYTRADTLV